MTPPDTPAGHGYPDGGGQRPASSGAAEAIELLGGEGQRVLDAMYDAVLVADGDGSVVFANRAATAPLRAATECVVGTHLSRLVEEPSQRDVVARRLA